MRPENAADGLLTTAVEDPVADAVVRLWVLVGTTCTLVGGRPEVPARTMVESRLPDEAPAATAERGVVVAPGVMLRDDVGGVIRADGRAGLAAPPPGTDRETLDLAEGTGGEER